MKARRVLRSWPTRWIPAAALAVLGLGALLQPLASAAVQAAAGPARRPPGAAFQDPSRPVTGTVRLAGGAPIVGAAVGQVVEIEAAFEASSAEGEVATLRTRVGSYCPPASEDLSLSPWRSFSPREMFPYPVRTGGIFPFALAVQYRDAAGRLSPLVCDSVSVEGIVTPGPPSTPEPTPTPVVADHQHFRVEAPWQEPDTFYNASDVAAGPDGTVYVLDGWNQRIVAFAPDGSFRDEWGGLGRGDGRLAMANGLAVAPDGSVYVSDIFQDIVGSYYPERLQRFSATGRLLGGCPGGIRADAVGQDGTLYGVWYRESGSEIRRHSADCRFLDRFGEAGSGPGQFGSWVDLAIAPDGRLFVADGGNFRIQVFSPEGRFLGQWGRRGREPGGFAGGLRLAIAGNGDVYVSEASDDWGRVQRFTADGRLLAQVGPVVGHWSDTVSDLSVGPDGSVYLLRWAPQRIERYRPDGSPWGQWGRSIAAIPQRELRDVALGPDGGIVALQYNQVQGYDALGERRWVHDLTSADEAFRSVDVAADGTVLALLGDRVRRLSVAGDKVAVDEWPLAPLSELQDLAAGPGGMVYLADGARHRVLALDAAGRVVAEWGAAGSENGQFPDTIALDVGSDGLVYVLDLSTAEVGAAGGPAQARSQRVQAFDAFGHFRGAFLVQSRLAGNLWDGSQATDIGVGPNGVVYLAVVGSEPADESLGWLVALTGAFGPDAEVGAGLTIYAPDDCPLGGFRPIALDAGADGRLAVVESNGLNYPRRLVTFGPGPAPGWRAVFHANRSRTDWPKVTRAEAVRFDWGEAGPLPGLPADGFVARFEGQVQGEASQPCARYALRVVADGGVRLWAEGRLLLDAWDADQVDETRDIELWTDQALAVVLETIDPGGRAAVQLDWTRRLTVRQRLFLPWSGALAGQGG